MIRVAVVGGGQIAQKVYLPVLAAMEDVEPAVLVEPMPERREQIVRAYRFGKAVADVKELSPGQVDCAFLLTRETVRRGPLTALLEMGLDVLCEKPLSCDLAEAEELAALAGKKGRILMVGFNRRFMPVYRKAKELLAGKTVDVCRVQKQGGRLVDHTVHMLDVLRFFCGDAVEIQAAGNFDGNAETLAAAVIRFDSGTVGIFETSAKVGARREEMEIHGRDAGGENAKGFTLYVEAPDRTVMYRDAEQTTYRPGQDTWYIQAERHYGFFDEIAHFLEAVRTRGVPECSAADAVKTHRLAFDILAKMRQHARPAGPAGAGRAGRKP
jgi:virulence factor